MRNSINIPMRNSTNIHENNKEMNKLRVNPKKGLKSRIDFW